MQGTIQVDNTLINLSNISLLSFGYNGCGEPINPYADVSKYYNSYWIEIYFGKHRRIMEIKGQRKFINVLERIYQDVSFKEMVLYFVDGTDDGEVKKLVGEKRYQEAIAQYKEAKERSEALDDG